MGYIKHNGALFVVFVGIEKESDFITKYYEWREKNNAKYFTDAEKVVNGYISFAKLVDGSKEGWKESDIAEKSIYDCIDFLDEYYKENKEFWYEVLITDFGGDDNSITTRFINGGL